MPEKAFERIASRAADRLSSQGFQSQPIQALSFQVNADGSVASTPTPAGGPRVFSLPDQVTTFTVAPDHLSWATHTYVRWQPFVGAVERYLLPVLSDMLEIVSVAGVRLEYWDRFVWSGTWADFDVRQLIRSDCPYLAPEGVRQSRQWHSHSGWFTKEGDFRRLTNINVDVVDVTHDPALQGRPSVGIYSSLMDQPNIVDYGSTPPAALDEAFMIERLEHHHLALKDILGHIIIDQMANRIELNARKAR
ncbi:hypothetical protein BSZ22_24555 [Bradyrhizobium canariense]|nr:hypothetical protein BSZ22_24555 [Bradyrhizobium canariense]OSI77499.1 hypothetical protein BSZ23_22615 [Bradyrhizobium canariense]